MIEEEILLAQLDMDMKGRLVDNKMTTLSAIKQDLMKLRSELISLMTTEKRIQTEIAKEKSEKNCLYMSLVSVEEEANRLRDTLNDLERNFLHQRDLIVMTYVTKRSKQCEQAIMQ